MSFRRHRLLVRCGENPEISRQHSAATYVNTVAFMHLRKSKAQDPVPTEEVELNETCRPELPIAQGTASQKKKHDRRGGRPTSRRAAKQCSTFSARFLGRRPRCARSWGRRPCEGNHSHHTQETCPGVAPRVNGLWLGRESLPQAWPAPESLQR